MSDNNTPASGSIVWHDLTVDNAEEIRSFYSEVVGWQSEPVDMGGYSDFNMNEPGDGKTAAGICHARGSNTDLPAQWLMYIAVDDAEKSAERCVQLGGKVLHGPRKMGSSTFCVIQDPAGAVAALISS